MRYVCHEMFIGSYRNLTYKRHTQEYHIMYKNLYKYILFPRCLSRHLGSPQWSSMVLRRHRLLLSVMFISSPPPLSGFYRKHPSTLYPVFLLFFFLVVAWPLSARSIVVSSQPLQPYVTVSGIFATPNTTRFSSCLSFHVILLIHINIFISFACNIFSLFLVVSHVSTP